MHCKKQVNGKGRRTKHNESEGNYQYCPKWIMQQSVRQGNCKCGSGRGGQCQEKPDAKLNLKNAIHSVNFRATGIFPGALKYFKAC
jgi:hypothetical protein